MVGIRALVFMNNQSVLREVENQKEIFKWLMMRNSFCSRVFFKYENVAGGAYIVWSHATLYFQISQFQDFIYTSNSNTVRM